MIKLDQLVSPQNKSTNDFTRVDDSMRLDQLPPGWCGVIAHVDDEDSSAERLKAMGVCAGRKVEVVKQGHPLILRVLGSRLGLSARLAKLVTVEACSSAQCSPIST